MIAQLLFATCCVAVLAADDKWVWGNNNGRDGLKGEHSVARPLVNVNVATSPASAPLFQSTNKNKILPQSDDPGEQARYEVFENGNGPGGAGDFPGRPPIRPPVQYQGRPIPGPGAGPQFRPPPPPPPRPQGPGGQFGRPPPPPPPPPGRPDLGVLTGPVPSWERPPPPKNNDPTSFDTCKCVNSFNCKSPGLKFGNCDVGKVYCCYNNPGFGLQPSGGGAFGSKNEGPPILAGPNGPIDRPRPDFLRPQGRPDEPFYNRPPPPGYGPDPYDEIVPRISGRSRSKN